MKPAHVFLFFLIVTSTVLFPIAKGSSQDLMESPLLAEAFRKAGVSGTFVLLDPNQGKFMVHNAKRANTRFVPASTFKIPNTLIALDCGAVTNVDEVLPYGGKPQPYPNWEKDMSLRDAMPISNVPIYQELARRVGLEQMNAGLKKLGYGNEETGSVVDRFWLDGPLEISAVEQTRFLQSLAKGELPFPEQNLEAVREISLLETKQNRELHGKTGWARSAKPGVGWFVGWVKQGDSIWPFALNLEMDDADALPTRVTLAKECLEILGAW